PLAATAARRAGTVQAGPARRGAGCAAEGCGDELLGRSGGRGCGRTAVADAGRTAASHHARVPVAVARRPRPGAAAARLGDRPAGTGGARTLTVEARRAGRGRQSTAGRT